MNVNNVFIVGSHPFNHWVQTQCVANGVPVTVLHIDEQMDGGQVERKVKEVFANSQQWDVAFDTLTGPLKLKQQVIHCLDQHMSIQVPLISSFLAHCATEMKTYCQSKRILAGFHPLHFHTMQLVEVAMPLQATDKERQSVQSIFKTVDKKVEWIADEVGGVFPRTLAMIVNEATYAYAEGVASVHDIDTAMQKGTNYPCGPLAWADAIGLDHILAILEGLYRQFGDDRYRPASLLKKKVWAGELGIKTNKGFYVYDTTKQHVG